MGTPVAMKLTASLLAIVGCALAIDNEYPGFHHFKGWYGFLAWDYHSYNLPGITTSIAKDLCAVDANCTALACLAQPCKGFPAYPEPPNTAYDVFLGIKGQNGTAPAAECAVESGGANVPTQKYLHCATDGWTIKNTYALPPDLIHSGCMQMPECVGFRIKNDEGSGDIFVAGPNGAGVFKI